MKKNRSLVAMELVGPRKVHHAFGICFELIHPRLVSGGGASEYFCVEVNGEDWFLLPPVSGVVDHEAACTWAVLWPIRLLQRAHGVCV